MLYVYTPYWLFPIGQVRPGMACRRWWHVGAAAAVGPGGGDRLEWGHLKRLYKAPTDYTEPQSPIQRYKILDKDIKNQTMVATNMNLTQYII